MSPTVLHALTPGAPIHRTPPISIPAPFIISPPIKHTRPNTGGPRTHPARARLTPLPSVLAAHPWTIHHQTAADSDGWVGPPLALSQPESHTAAGAD